MVHISVVFGFLRLLQHLVVWGIDLQVPDDMGLTALHYAYFFQQEECLVLLLRSGANRFVLDHLGRTPSDLAPQLDRKLRLDPLGSYIGDTCEPCPSRCSLVTDCDLDMPEEAEMLNAKYLLVQRWVLQVESDHCRESSPSRRKAYDLPRDTQLLDVPPTMEVRSTQGKVPCFMLYNVLTLFNSSGCLCC